MHARRPILGPPGAKLTSLPGPDEQLDLYGATDTPVVRTDRLAPASFKPPPQIAQIARPSTQFQPPPPPDYSADLQFAELLMSDTDESLAQLRQLKLSAMVPGRVQHPKAKFAGAPSRAHARSSTSNNSSPATVSTKLSVDQLSTDHSVSQPEQDVRPVKPKPKHEEQSPPPRSSPTEPASPSNTATKQRSTRPNRRSPAPRRQECTTCGKKFQRPCQLVTHIRSHTGEQPHACPVCSRRFSVLSNCQRHVKLCQKRSAKVLNPSEDDFGTDSPGVVTSFIQFPNDSSAPSQPAPVSETASRRSHEVPIRPKLVSRESGSAGSVVSAPGHRQNRAGSSSSGGSPVPKLEAPSMPRTLERSGSGSAVPVVPSSSTYPSSSSYGYQPSNTYGTYHQGAYESGTAFNNAYAGYNAPGSGYEQVPAGFKQNNVLSNFEATSAAAYESLNPSFNAPSSGSGYEHSVPAYETTSPGYDRPESGYSQPRQPYAAATATATTGPPHTIQSLPSPSHVQTTPHSTASPTTASHDGNSYFTSIPGMYAAPSARRPSVTSSVPSSRRSTTTYTQVQRDAIGFCDAGVTDTSNIGATNDPAAGPPIVASGPYYSSSSGLVASYEPQQLKQEETVSSDMAQQTWGKQQAYQTGYSDSQWTSAAATETPAYHAYHTESASSSSDLAGPHESHVASTSTGYATFPQQQQQQPQQPHRQQLYLQTQGGYPDPSGQQQQHGTYGNAAYASRSAAYGVNSGVVSVPRHAHQDSSSYAWPGSESTWNTQSGYHS